MNFSRTGSAIVTALLASAMLLAAPVSQASTIQLDYTRNLGNPTGRITNDGSPSPTIRAGEFIFDAIPGDSMYWDDQLSAFCIEIDMALAMSAHYTISSGLGSFNATQQGHIAALFSSYYADSKASATASAAFQLALWEIINEDSGSLDLTAGTFSSTAFGSGSGARGLASQWLANLDSDTGSYEFFIFSSPDSQNLIAVRAVPEPAMLALLGAGLLGGALLRRRRA